MYSASIGGLELIRNPKAIGQDKMFEIFTIGRFKTIIGTTLFFLAIVPVESYSECLMKKYTKKFSCGTSSQNAFVEQEMLNQSSLVCIKRLFLSATV